MFMVPRELTLMALVILTIQLAPPACQKFQGLIQCHMSTPTGDLLTPAAHSG